MIIRARSGKEVKREKLFVERPTEFAFAYNFGELEWVSNEEVRLISKDGKETWSVDVKGDQ